MKTVSIFKHLAIVVLLTAGLSGCVKEQAAVNPGTGQGDKMVTISMSVPGAATPRPASRALTDVQERDITTVHVMLFYPSDAGGGKAGVYYTTLPGKNISGTGDNRNFEVKVPVGTYDFVVLANAGSAVSDATISAGMTKAQVMPLLQIANTAKWSDGTVSPAIPMWGEKNGYTVDENTTQISTVAEPIEMHRMLAKVSVQLSNKAASGSASDASGTGNFALGSIHLYNQNTRGYVVPDLAATNWHVGDGTKENPSYAKNPTIPTANGKPANGTKLSYTVDDDATATGDPKYGTYFSAKEIKNLAYTFEAENTDAMSHFERPCAVIGGYYKGSTTQTFYRVDFVSVAGNTTSFIDIKRNHNYIFLINSVTGEGYPDEDSAFNAASSNLEATIVDWIDVEMPVLATDGTDYLALSQGEFTFDRDGVSTTKSFLKIKTNVAGGWNAVASKEDSHENKGQAVPDNWLSISPLSGSTGESTNLTVKTNNGDERDAYIHVTAGRINMVVPVHQTTEAAMSIRIYEVDADGESNPRPLSTLEFGTRTGEAEAGPKYVRVEWSPKEAVLNVSSMKIGEGEDFRYAAGSDTFDDHYIDDSSGAKVYKIDPQPLGNSTGNPFFERSFMATFNLQYEGRPVISNLSVRHFNFNGTIEVDGVYLLDAQTKTFTVKSNTDWKAYYVEQIPDAGTPDKFIEKIGSTALPPYTQTGNKILIAQGSNNMPNGRKVSFEVSDELHKNPAPTLYTGHGYIVLESALDDDDAKYYADKNATLFCASALIRQEANSYIVHNNGTDNKVPIMFPLSQIVKATPADTDHGALPKLPSTWISGATPAKMRAAVLWSDVNNFTTAPVVESVIYAKSASGTIADGHIIVIPGSAVGNAVVMLFEDNDNGTDGKYIHGTDKILWSWHIWNVAYNPYKDYYATNLEIRDDATWLDRNLGATANAPGANNLATHGFHYQWGRKDPHPSSGNGSVVSNTDNAKYYFPSNVTGITFSTPAGFTGITNNLENATKNPLTRYYASASPYDWFTTGSVTTHQELWGVAAVNAVPSSPYKSVYDPCPEGYRVPIWNTSNTTKYWVATSWGTPSYGRDHASYGGYYPLAGNRTTNGPTLSNVGSYGYYWSATMSSTTSSYGLYMGSSGYTTPSSSSNRGDGFSVRCVAE
ncbi:fimbrial protein [uncultured Alistipes sp.]|uniref:fimbrial protein n=1 Tax=uncultured Alistipes sp. TaxID=538949 RepID=UPI0025EF8B45|nr:fimbrial protein [uncultured Alistipes sp.]